MADQSSGVYLQILRTDALIAIKIELLKYEKHHTTRTIMFIVTITSINDFVSEGPKNPER